VHLVALSATGFRNLETFRLEPNQRFNILEGRNGQGKTNLLEAVYLLSAFRSFRDAKNRELVAWGEDQATVFGEVVRRGVGRTVEVTVAAGGKKVALDGKTITRLPAELAHLNAVVFGPDDLALTKAGPAERRRFLDRAVYAVWPDHVNDLRGYAASLKRRNKLLKEAGPARVDPGVIAAFEQELLAYGARVVHRRHAFLAGYRPHFERIFHEITGGELEGTIRYRGFDPRAEPPADLPAIVARFEEALDEARETDLRRGFTSPGPHTHDLAFTLGRRSARIYASQGQHRAFVLALKIAELQRIREAIGDEPVFLLDDVSSELDEGRNADLMRYLDQAGGQVFITTTDRRWIRVSGSPSVFRLEAGAVTRAV